MTTEDRIRAALQYLGYSEDRILEILATIAAQDSTDTPASTTPTPVTPAVVDDIFTADAGHSVNDVFTYTGQTATGNDTIRNFDNISGDGSSSDRLDLSAVFDALGGKYTDGVNDFEDRKAALHFAVGDFDGDGAKDDAKLTIDGLKDFSIAFVNPVTNTPAAFHVASQAGGTYADIVVGGGASAQTQPSPTPTTSQPQTQSTPTPSPTPSSGSSPSSTPSSTNGLFEEKYPAHYARLTNGVNIEQTQFGSTSDEELRLLKSMGVEHIRIFIKPDEYVSPGNAVNPATNQTFQSAVHFMERAIDAGLAVVFSPMGRDYHAGFIGNPNDQASINMNIGWWREMANYVNSHFSPQDVFLEIYNEPFMRAGQDAWWNIAGQLASAIRQAAPDFTLIATSNGYDNGEWGFIESLVKSAPFPVDNVVYNVHYYDPVQFTHQGASWLPEFKNFHDQHYPGTLGYSASWIDSDFAALQAWADKYGVYTTVNEFGAITYAAEPDRMQYLTDVRTAAEHHNVGWSVWELDKIFSISHAVNGVQTLDLDVQQALTLGAYQDGGVNWETLAQNTSQTGTSTPVTDPTNDPQHNTSSDSSTSTSTTSTSGSTPSTTQQQASTTPLEIHADKGFLIEEKFVFTASDLHRVVTIFDYDSLSNPDMINDQIDLRAIFTALGGKFSDGVNDLADRKAAVHIVQTDLDYKNGPYDTLITIDGAPDFALHLIHPIAPTPESYQLGDGTGIYDDILIA